MKLYNSLTRKLEEFKPIVSGKAGVYTCGPTVYDYIHIGNWRTYVLGDLLVRTLTWNGFKIDYIMNITDVGHLTGDNAGDADTGEDRMEKAAEREGKTAWEIAKFYTQDFLAGYDKLNLIKPKQFTKATEHIAEQIELVKKIEAAGFTYKIEDAKTAGLTDRAIWQKHPAAMLRARCASTLARIVYPDVMLGQDPDVEVENAQRSVSINGKVMDVRLSPPVQLPPEAPTPPKPTVRPTKQPPKQKLTQEQKAQHALALKGMGTREAAKHIAADLSAHGIGPSPQEAIRVIADCCEKRGISPHQATIDDLFAAWMELLS